MKPCAVAAIFVLMAASPAWAQQAIQGAYVSPVFKDGPKGEKIHIASGFTCPDRIGRYMRDAVGESDLAAGTDFCSYYALDGVYGTIKLTPRRRSYDPATALEASFVEQQGIGAKDVGQKTVKLGPKGDQTSVYTRTYETARLETLHYRIKFSGAAIGKWIVETTVEYAEPRDDTVAHNFLEAVYGAALKEIAGAKKAK